MALELPQGGVGVGAEDAVDAPGVEPEAPEATLQVGDVVAPEHGAGEVEDAVTEV